MPDCPLRHQQTHDCQNYRWCSPDVRIKKETLWRMEQAKNKFFSRSCRTKQMADCSTHTHTTYITQRDTNRFIDLIVCLCLLQLAISMDIPIPYFFFFTIPGYLFCFRHRKSRSGLLFFFLFLPGPSQIIRVTRNSTFLAFSYGFVPPFGLIKL